MRYDEVETHLKHPKTINNNIYTLRIFPFYPYKLRMLCYHSGSTPEAPQRTWEHTPKGTSWTLPLKACFENKVWEARAPLQCSFKRSRPKSQESWVKLRFSDLNWTLQSKDPIQNFLSLTFIDQVDSVITSQTHDLTLNSQFMEVCTQKKVLNPIFTVFSHSFAWWRCFLLAVVKG